MGKLPPLMQTIIDGWKRHSPVDSLVISSELKLLGRQPVNELLFSGRNARAAYEGFLNASLTGESPGLSRKNEGASTRSVDDLDRLSIELLGKGKFKIDGKGPLNAKESRAEVLRQARGKSSVLVLILSDAKTVGDGEYEDIKRSLHGKGGMLGGINIKGVGEFGR